MATDTTWWGMIPLVLVALLLLWGPGVLIALAAGLQRRLVLVVAPALSVTVVSITAVVAPLIGVSWGVLPLLCASLLLGLVALPLRWLPRRTAHQWAGKWAWFLVALTIGASLQCVRLVRAFVRPWALSQTYDNAFHLNLVDLFVTRGDASFLHVNLIHPDQPHGFYPAAWHEIVSLLVEVTGVPIPNAVNALTIVVTALLWPLGVGVLIASLKGSWNAGVTAGLLAFALPQMPNHFVWFGVLYPNLLGYALLPSFLLVAHLVLLGDDEEPGTGESRRRLMVIGAVGLIGLGVAHPNALFALVVLVTPLLLIWGWRLGSRLGVGRAGHGAVLGGIVGIALVVSVLVLLERLTWHISFIASMRQGPSWWAPEGSLTRGVVRVLTMNAGWHVSTGGVIPFVLGALVILGAIFALRSWRTAWIIGAHAFVALLYLVAWRVHDPLRAMIIGVWYGDPNRLVALLGVTAVLLLALAVDGLVRLIQGLRPATNALALSMSLGCLVLGLGQVNPNMTEMWGKVSENFSFDSGSSGGGALLSEDEVRLLERLDEDVPENDVIIGNPWNGSVMAGVFSERRFTFPHVSPVDAPDARYVAEHLWEAPENDRVCEALERSHVRYLLDFGRTYLWQGDSAGRHLLYPELDGTVERRLTREVDHEGEAKLLEITACDPPSQHP